MISKSFLSGRYEIDRQKVYTAIILGTSTAILLYFLLIGIKEILRINTAELGIHHLMVLTPNENFKINLFWASISVVFGVNTALSFFMKNALTAQPHSRVNSKKNYILTHANGYHWYFMNWIFKVASIFGILFPSFAIQFEISFLDEFWLLLLLMPLVYYLNQWNPIFRVFRNKSYKWFGWTSLTATLFIFLLAMCNIWDYQKANDNLLKHKLSYKHTIELPESSYFTYPTHKRHYNTFYLHIVIDSLSNPIMYETDPYGNHAKEVTKENVLKKLLSFKNSQWSNSKVRVQLHSDGKVNMKYISDIKEAIQKSGIPSISYAIKPMHTQYFNNHPQLRNITIDENLYPYLSHWDSVLTASKTLDFTKHKVKLKNKKYARFEHIKHLNRIKITIDSNSTLRLNNTLISKDQLTTYLQQFIEKYSCKYALIYEVDEKVSYAEYIQTKALLYSSIYEMRNNLSIELNDVSYDKLFDDYQSRILIKEKYPFSIYEYTRQEKQLIYLLDQ